MAALEGEVLAGIAALSFGGGTLPFRVPEPDDRGLARAAQGSFEPLSAFLCGLKFVVGGRNVLVLRRDARAAEGLREAQGVGDGPRDVGRRGLSIFPSAAVGGEGGNVDVLEGGGRGGDLAGRRPEEIERERNG